MKSNGRGYETRDASTRLVLWTGIGLTIMVVAASAGMLLVFDVLADRESGNQPELPALARSASEEPPEPRLQSLPRKDLAEVAAGEEQVLTSYGWVDREAGVARVPIERAMEIVAEHGVPARTPPALSEQESAEREQ